MKIEKNRLKQIIKEELEVGSVGPSMHTAAGEQNEGHDESDGHMAKSNLYKILEYAQELYEMIDDNEDLEPWVEEKIAIAGYIMDSVGHYMRYEKHSEHEESEGEEDHLDLDGEGEEDEYELEIDTDDAAVVDDEEEEEY